MSADPEDWLPNPHAGEMVRTEFLGPLGMSATDIAREIGVPAQRMSEVIDGKKPMDAELDLRLARYFRVSDGFFLRLEADYQLLEERRRLGSELDRIVPRAA